LPDLSNETIGEVYEGAKAAAGAANVDIMQGGATDTAQWVSACDSIVNANVDVIAYDTLDPAGTKACILRANERQIPIICLMSCVLDAKNDTFLTLDYRGNGVKIGEWMAEAVGGEGQVGLLLGPPGEQGTAA